MIHIIDSNDELKCPKCKEEMIIQAYYELMGEYQGTPAYERRCGLVCENCGYADD